MRHRCSRIVLFVASAERAAPMVVQLLAALPTHEPAAFAPPQKAQLLLDELMRVGGADDANLVSSALEQESKGNSRLRKQARSSMRDVVRHGGRAIVERGARVKRVLKNQTPVR